MDVNGFHITSEPSGQPLANDEQGEITHDGHLTTVTDPNRGVIRGPFHVVAEAVRAAHAWKAENAEANAESPPA